MLQALGAVVHRNEKPDKAYQMFRDLGQAKAA
jgi:hypothetical protein